MSASSVSVKVVTWEGFPSVEKAAALKEELVLALAQASPFGGAFAFTLVLESNLLEHGHRMPQSHRQK